jgi:hypothetical protein
MKDTRELRDKNKKEAIKTISGFRNMRFMWARIYVKILLTIITN